MNWSEAVGGAVGGVIGGGATLLSGYLQNKANRQMNADNLRLAYIQRGDALAQAEKDNKFAVQDRAYRDRAFAYQQRQDRRAAIRQRLQDDMGYRNNILAMVNAARGGRAL